jgi:hypothetical protein
MVCLDVLALDVDTECKEQADYLYQLGYQLLYQRHYTTPDTDANTKTGRDGKSASYNG